MFFRQNPFDNVLVDGDSLKQLYQDTVKPLVNTIFPNKITGGTHALPFSAIKKLIVSANIRFGDFVWEIGMGVPYLAVMLGCVTHRTVIGTDIGK